MSTKKHKDRGDGEGETTEPAKYVAPRIETGSVVLTVPRVDAAHKEWPAGSVIWPNVEGWPENRVKNVLSHGFAAIAE